LSVHCECPAGECGKLCKHKWQLLNGDEKMLFDLSQLTDLKTINSIAIERGLGDLYKEVESLEKLKKSLAKDQKKEKDSVNKSLSNRNLLNEVKFIEANSKLHEIDKKISFTNYLISKQKDVVEKKLKNGF
jgi:tetrahydromethanopterin S-methyltransferase subunit G